MKRENFLRIAVTLTALVLLLLLCSIGATLSQKVAFADSPEVIATIYVLDEPLTLKVGIPLNRQLKAVNIGGYKCLCRSLLKEGVAADKVLTYISEDLQGIWDYLSKLEIKPKSAQLVVCEYGFEYIEESIGFAFDKADVAIKVAAALDGELNYLKMEKVVPKETIESLKEKTLLIGSYSTSAVNSSDNRKNNIALASNRLNGITISPDEVLSFNKTVGKRSIENGFREATVISDGEYVEGIGGGICQVATTLYNALLKSGFICTAYSHSYPASYVPPSLDCMVSEYADFIFKNTSDENVYIFSGFKKGRIWFEIFGKKSNAIIPLSRIIKRVPYKNLDNQGKEITPTSDMTLVTKGIEGIISEAYYINTKGEEVVFRRNSYKTRNAVWEIKDTAIGQ